MVILLLVVIAIVVVWAPWHKKGEEGGVPDEVFAPFSGRWQGTFWSYDVDGSDRESYRQRMTFQSIEPDSMIGRVVRFSLGGDTLGVDSVFLIRRDDSLYSIRIHDDGRRELDRGFWADGQIIWRSRDMFGRLKHAYREQVRNDIWEIDGFSRTDKGGHLMQYGRALRQ